MQIVADVLQQPIQRSRHPGSCLGAAWTAAIGAGLTDDWRRFRASFGLGDRFGPIPPKRASMPKLPHFRELYRGLSAS